MPFFMGDFFVFEIDFLDVLCSLEVDVSLFEDFEDEISFTWIFFGVFLATFLLDD